jgi:2-oxoglutarate ferredoxin oxidoreductase subunit gamma
MSPNDPRIKLRIGGSGGQGVVLASVILAEAIAIHDGRQVVQTQSYGPEARGGYCKAELVISNSSIDYPQADNLDILVALNQSSLDEFIKDLKEDGILIVNSDHVGSVSYKNSYAIPFTTLAREKVGVIQTMNIITLGALSSLTSVVSPAALKEAVLARAPKGTSKTNLEALEIGLSEGLRVKEQMSNPLPKKFSELLLTQD